MKYRTPLHIAALCSNFVCTKILLSHGAVANTQDFSGNTALHYAGSPEMTRILLEGGISPNIPNGAGVCSLHLAVKRRDLISVKHLLSHGADVNNADHQHWFTPLHLVAHAQSQPVNASLSLRGPIAELLCEVKLPTVPDFNYQDKDGNSPLHHAASLVEEDAGILISLFVEHGSSPSIPNQRGQTPIHLFCHNQGARQFDFYHEALDLMLVKGADPNTSSLSGCTALHLAVYHHDIEAAALLVRHGAQVNMKWKKPAKWETSWTDMGSDDVYPLDMLEDLQSLHQLLSEITSPQIPAPRRLRCMHCKAKFGMFTRHHNCTHCGRSVCLKCCNVTLRQTFFPTLTNSGEGSSSALMKVCSLCEPILLSKMERVPMAIISVGCDQSSIGTISM
jgi:ankyrin repeat protein